MVLVHQTEKILETKIAPATLGLEDEFPFGKASCEVGTVSFWECNS